MILTLDVATCPLNFFRLNTQISYTTNLDFFSAFLSILYCKFVKCVEKNDICGVVYRSQAAFFRFVACFCVLIGLVAVFFFFFFSPSLDLYLLAVLTPQVLSTASWLPSFFVLCLGTEGPVVLRSLLKSEPPSFFF